MNSQQRVLAALQLRQPDKVPFLDDVDQDTMDQIMGSSDYTLAQFAGKLGLDGVCIRNYNAPAFYSTQQGTNGRNFMGDGLIKSPRDLDLMVFPDYRRPDFFDPLHRFVEENSKAGLATYAEMRFGPSGAFYSLGMETLAFALHDQPHFVEQVLERYTEYNLALLETINNSGLDFVITYDNICYNSGPVFSPKMYRQIFLPWEKQVAQACRLPWVCHMDGNISKIIEDMLTLGMSGLHPIEPEPGLGLSEMKQRYGKQVCLWGNVDLQYILPYGTEAETIADVQRCLRQGGAGGGYIIGSSNGLPNYCKTANILAMASAIAEYGWYPLSSQQQ